MDNRKTAKYACPCCGYFTLNNEADNTFQICPVCYWEDDGIQLKDPTYEGGANHISLNQAKENFKKFSAIEEQFKKYVPLLWKKKNINKFSLLLFLTFGWCCRQPLAFLFKVSAIF